MECPDAAGAPPTAGEAPPTPTGGEAPPTPTEGEAPPRRSRREPQATGALGDGSEPCCGGAARGA